MANRACKIGNQRRIVINTGFSRVIFRSSNNEKPFKRLSEFGACVVRTGLKTGVN